MTLKAQIATLNSTRRGKDGGRGADQEDIRQLDGVRIEHAGESVQPSPNLRMAWSSTQVADYFRRRRIRLLQVEEAGRRGGPAGSSVCAVGGGTASAGRFQQEEDEDSRLDQAYSETKRAAGESSSRKHGLAARRCSPKSRERNRKGSEREGADGTGKLSSLSERLTRSRRQLELIASATRATRELN